MDALTIVLAIVWGLVTYVIATYKKRDGFVAFIVGLILGVIGVIIYVILPEAQTNKKK